MANAIISPKLPVGISQKEVYIKRLCLPRSKNSVAKVLLKTAKNRKEESKKTLYDVLGISQDATPEKIKMAYRKNVKIWHPDLVAAKSENGEEMFFKIREAYLVLYNTESRIKYDNTLRMQEICCYRDSRFPFCGSEVDEDEQDFQFVCRNWESDQCW